MWRDCRKRDSDYKALRLALKLSASTVQSISILYPRYQSIAKFLSQVHSCRQVRYLTLSGKLPSDATLNKLFSQLPLLFFSVTVEDKDHKSIFPLVHAKAKDLKILRIVTVDDYNTGCMYFGIPDWKACGYFPPNLQVCYPSVLSGWRLRNLLDKLSKSDHPAKLAFYTKCSSAAGNLVNKYPLVEIVLYPNVQVASCFVSPSSPDSPVLALCNGKSCVPSEEYISATYFENPYTPFPGNSLPFLPPTIESLCLAGLGHLTSTDLSSISECCPNLRCLNISRCSKALLSLSGLADIGENCLQLTSLNIKFISEVESVATLWDVLASIKKLRHLAMDDKSLLSSARPFDIHSLSHVSGHVKKMNLTAFEMHNNRDCLQLDILLPAFRWLRHLQISGHVPRLTQILPNIPNLAHFTLQNDYPVDVPSNPLCYPSLKQICIRQQDVSEDFLRALAYSRSLTHIYMLDARFFSPYLQFEDFPWLCEVCTLVQPKEKHRANIESSPKQFSLEDHGICGFVKERKGRRFLVEVDPDLKSLWPHI